MYVLIAVARLSSCVKVDEYEGSYHKGFGNGRQRFNKGLSDSYQDQMGNTQGKRDLAIISSYGKGDGPGGKEFGMDYEGGINKNDGDGRHQITLGNSNKGVSEGDSYGEPLRYNHGEEGGRHSDMVEHNYRGRNGKGQGDKFANDHQTGLVISHVGRVLDNIHLELEHGKNVENNYGRGKQQSEVGSNRNYEGLGGGYGAEVLDGINGDNKEFGGSYKGGSETSSKDRGGRASRNGNYGGKGLESGYDGNKGFDVIYGLGEELRDAYGGAKMSEGSYKLYKEIVDDYEDSKGSRDGYSGMFGENQGSEGSYGGGKGQGNIYGNVEGSEGGYGEHKILERGYKGKIGSKEFEDLYDVIVNRHRMKKHGQSGRGKEKTIFIPVIKHVPIIQHVPVIEHIKVVKKTNKGEGDTGSKKYELRDSSFIRNSKDLGGRGYKQMSNSGSDGGFRGDYGQSGWMMDTMRNGHGGGSGSRRNLGSERGGSSGKLPSNNGGSTKSGGHFGQVFGRHVNEVW